MDYDYEIMHAAIKILDRRAREMDDELYHKYGVNADYNEPPIKYRSLGGLGPGFDGRLATEIKNYMRTCIDDEIKRIDDNNPEYAKLLYEHGNSRAPKNDKQEAAMMNFVKSFTNKIYDVAFNKLVSKYGSKTVFDYRTQVDDKKLKDVIEDRLRKHFHM